MKENKKEKINVSVIMETYGRETGKRWTETEGRMLEICIFFTYGFKWDSSGSIVISDSTGGTGGIDERGLEFSGKNSCGHLEYASAEEMVKDWEGECITANRTAAENGVPVPFGWI